MSNIITAAAYLVLPVCASVTAGAVAFGAFLGRREFAATASAAHTTDLMTTTGWSGMSVKRNAFATSYVPQSRGSTG